jgi:serine-aspartate repeat-containing protein C/D/E
VTPTPNSANLSAKLVGDVDLHEGGKAGSYRIELNEVSSQDRQFTITIADGTANRIDANKGTVLGNATMPTFTGNGTSVLENQQVAKSFEKWGDVYWKTVNTAGNGYQVTDNKDFTVFKSDGTLNKGNTITVKVAAGQKTSDAFQVNAWAENVIAPWALVQDKLAANESFYGFFGQEQYYVGTGRTAPEVKTVQEGNETLSLKVTEAGGVKLEADKLDVNIVDKSKVQYISPIALDLNEDGIQTVGTEAGVLFDILNTGTAVNTGWISGGDAFLAFDRNYNGAIDDRSELFGGGVGEGFADLATFDSNGDGVVDASDIAFESLSLWKDSNVNGITDAGELASLSAYGVTALNVNHTNDFTQDANGNILGESSTAIKNGQSIAMTDVYFKLG